MIYVEGGMGGGILTQQASVPKNICCKKFKRIDNDIQTNAIVDDGFSIDIFFHNEPVDK